MDWSRRPSDADIAATRGVIALEREELEAGGALVRDQEERYALVASELGTTPEAVAEAVMRAITWETGTSTR